MPPRKRVSSDSPIAGFAPASGVPDVPAPPVAPVVQEMSDDVALAVLVDMAQEQNFYDQMRLSWKHVGALITKFKSVQAKMPELIARELELRTSIGSLESDIESKRRAGATKIQEEHDRLQKEMITALQPTLDKLNNAKENLKIAETKAQEAESNSVARVKTAASAAEAAESRLASANKKLAELGELTRR